MNKVCLMAASIGGRPGASTYAAGKGAVDVFTTGFAREMAAEGARVNAVRDRSRCEQRTPCHTDGGQCGAQKPGPAKDRYTQRHGTPHSAHGTPQNQPIKIPSRLTDAELVVVLEQAAANLEAGGDKKGARSVRQAAKILRKEEAARGERRRVKKKQ